MEDKTKIVSLSYNCMFKAIFANNKYMLSKLVQSVLDYCELNINVMNKELIMVNNELPLNNAHDRQLICDYRIKIDDNTELNIESNRAHYPGLEERNMCYCFKIYCDHFKEGDEYDKFEKYFLVQVNFNNFSNPENDTIKDFYLLDVKNPKNYLTKNVCFINVDIASCFKKFYNENKLEEMSNLEKFGAMLKTDYLEDISNILGSMIDMRNKKKFLKQVEDMSKDKDILEAIKLEDNIEYRFDLVKKEGIEQNTIEMIQQMLKNDASLDFVSKVTGKTIEEIKKIANLK